MEDSSQRVVVVGEMLSLLVSESCMGLIHDVGLVMQSQKVEDSECQSHTVQPDPVDLTGSPVSFPNQDCVAVSAQVLPIPGQDWR